MTFSAFKKFLGNESGATAIEYGLIISLLALAIITSMNLLSKSLIDLFTNISTELNDVPVIASDQL